MHSRSKNKHSLFALGVDETVSNCANNNPLLSPPKEGGYVLPVFVCLSVAAWITQKVMNRLNEIFGGVGRGPSNNRLDFAGDPKPLPLFAAIFSPPNDIEIVYCYSRDGSTMMPSK